MCCEICLIFQLFDNLIVKLNVTMALFKLFYIKLDLVRDNNVQSFFLSSKRHV